MNVLEIDDLIIKSEHSGEMSKRLLHKYQKHWKVFKKWLTDKGINSFDRKDIENYLDEILGSHISYASLSYKNQIIFSALNALIRWFETGQLRKRPILDEDVIFVGETGCYFKSYLASLFERGATEGTVKNYRSDLLKFMLYLNAVNKDLSELTASDFSNYFSSLNVAHSTKYHIKSHLSVVLKNAYEQGVTSCDLSELIMKEKIVNDEKMPTTFSQEEIAQILKAVDTCTVIGKRDYAILLCVVAYGWRRSDIVDLKLSSINWRTREISFVQRKTGVEVNETLVSDVFLAIVDYIRNARPETKTKEIFVSANGKHLPICTTAINGIINKYLFRAGIKNLENRRHGPHALRFSLATHQIEQGTPISTVKSILGHKSTEVTLNYIRLDVEGLKRCVLPMPPCQSPWYKEI